MRYIIFLNCVFLIFCWSFILEIHRWDAFPRHSVLLNNSGAGGAFFSPSGRFVLHFSLCFFLCVFFFLPGYYVPFFHPPNRTQHSPSGPTWGQLYPIIPKYSPILPNYAKLQPITPSHTTSTTHVFLRGAYQGVTCLNLLAHTVRSSL